MRAVGVFADLVDFSMFALRMLQSLSKEKVIGSASRDVRAADSCAPAIPDYYLTKG